MAPKTAKTEKTKERPLSPHLQIYKPQLTTVLSIMHRLTGVGLSIVSLVFVYWLWSLAMGPASYKAAMGLFTSLFGKGVLMLATLGFAYHLANGIRHLVWDVGFGYSLAVVYRSGWTVLVLTVLMTLWVWL
jgi:succinate dehydrogenase / fumarate reductase, cytochrome b subunit